MPALEVTTPLFGRMPLRQRPPSPRAARRPPTPLVHVAPLDELLQHDAARPIEAKDPYHEFRNDWEHVAVTKRLVTLPNDYQHSVAWLRANRPSSNGEALRFWLAPLSRAHMLNALLMRDDRTLALVQDDVQIPRDKLYQYLQRWGVTFEIRRRHVTVEDPERRRAPGTIQRWRITTGTALVRLDGYTTTLEARFDRISRTYRIPTRLPLLGDELLSARAASHLLGLNETDLKRIVPTAHRSNAGVHLYDLLTLDTFRPRAAWRLAPSDARAAANACRCAYWDDHTGTCGLKHALPMKDKPPREPTSCSDHEPLDGPSVPPRPAPARGALARALAILLRHHDALHARLAAPALWTGTPRELEAFGVRDGQPLPPNLRAALGTVARLQRILTLPAERLADLARLARHAALLTQARGGPAVDAPPLLATHRLLAGDRLTLRGAAVLNELEALAAQLDTHAC